MPFNYRAISEQYRYCPKILLVVFIAIAGFGCATVKKDMYVQPDLPLDQVALINRLTNEQFIFVLLYSYAETVHIVSIGGKPVKITSKIKLLPGRHEVVAQYLASGSAPTKPNVEFSGNFAIDVEAGHEYKIRGGAKEGVIRIWVEDIETRAVVGMSSMLSRQK